MSDEKVLMCPMFMEGAGCWHYEDCTTDIESIGLARQRMVDHLHPNLHEGRHYTRDQAEKMVRDSKPVPKAKIMQRLERRR